ncbi:MAG: PEP-CTERM sorting domain-containing protein [Phycisphaerae bacterium]|nr:PEP-CTERM sorting domain-containing protein [Phycisphaerae bacterium]
MRNATILLAVVAVLALAGQAQATDYYWDATSGEWNTTTNWNPNGTPTTDDMVYIENGGTCSSTAGPRCSANSLYVGTSTGSGTMTMINAGTGFYNSLTNAYVGYAGTGVVNVGVSSWYKATWNYVGREAGGNGTLNMTGGNFYGYGTGIGYNGATGTLNFSGGDFNSGTGVSLGYGGGKGIANISGGVFHGWKMSVSGTTNTSEFNILDNSANISFNNGGVKFGEYDTWANVKVTAVEGSSIRLTGGNTYIENRTTDASVTGLAGLNNITFVFENGTDKTAKCEVGGADLGAVMAGLVENFALEGLTVGTATKGSNLTLVDASNNQQDALAEVLYVETLDILAGSTLDLSGLTLYYLNGEAPSAYTGDGRVFDGGTGGQLIQIPEPATMVLLGIGGIGVLLRRRSRA